MPPRRAAAAKASAPTSRKRNPAADDSDAESVATVPSTSTRPRRTARAVSNASTVPPSDVESEPEPETPPKKKAAPARKSRAKKVKAESDDDEEHVEPEPTPKPAPKSTRKGKGKAAAPPPEEPDDDDVFTPKANRKLAHTTPKPLPKKQPVELNVPEVELDSEDESFMASGGGRMNRTMPTPKQQPAPAVDESEEEDIDMTEVHASKPIKTSSQPLPIPIKEPEPQGPRARLIIHKLVLINFKSYAGRQEIGPFHKSFSAIVGPNGSGKSNTIDALLFVFGYRAAKMRQGKLSELIHNSADFPDLQDCSVEVHFREIFDTLDGGAEVVPGSSLAVTRTAYKNNSSKYTINNKTSNFKEVTELLKGKGIDLDHNRFLILQGEVESIAQMKPKAPTEHEDGLLEYLEDIIGTAHYKERIDSALAELERVGEDRADKLSRLKLVEKEKAKLEEGKREAEDYIRTQNQWVRSRSRYVQWNMWQMREVREQTGATVEKIETELKEEEEKHKDDLHDCEELNKQYEDKSAAYETIKKLTATIVKNLGAHEKEQVGLEERRKHAEGKAKKLEKSIKEDTKAKTAAQRTTEESEQKIAKETKNSEELEEQLEEAEKALEAVTNSLRGKTQVFHDQIEAKQKELAPWTTKINTLKGNLDVAAGERDMLLAKVEQAREATRKAEENVQDLKRQRQDKQVETDDIKRDGASLSKEEKAERAKLAQLKSSVEQLRSQATSARQKVDEAKSNLQQNTSSNAVLDSLTRLRDAGRVSGFHGRLGGLGTIPAEYDVAITTACGGLNNLIVDNVEQAQQCMNYLRNQNIGRATFIALDKLSKSAPPSEPTPENVPRLFDLIKPRDAKFAAAFYKVVGNTVVAKDLTQANRVAFGGGKRWRVVTLEGQVIESSGAMSGGGTRVQRGGMSAKLASDAVTPDVMKRYERDNEEAARALEEQTGAMAECEATLDRLAKQIPHLEMRQQKINMDLTTLTTRITDAEKRLKELRGSSNMPDAGDATRVKALEVEIKATEAELAKVQTKADEIEEAIKSLEKKILDVGGSKLLAQKSKVDGIKTYLKLSADEISKAEVAKTRAEKDLKRLAKAVKDNEQQLEGAADELKTLQEQYKECTDALDDMRAKVQEAQEAADGAKDELKQLKSELDEKQGSLRKFKQKQLSLQQKLEDSAKALAECEARLERYQLMHDELALEEVDDDDDDEEEEAKQEDADSTSMANGERATNGEGKPPSSQDAMQVDGQEDVKPKIGKDGKVREKHDPMELQMYSDEELAQFNKADLLAEQSLFEERLKNAKPNMHVLKEYRKREEEFLKRAADLDAVTAERDQHKKAFDDLCKARYDEFMAGFGIISAKLKEMYQTITFGGMAELELIDSMDPFAEGITFSVMPPKKSWKNISNLSGGEKTLSSLALVFALHEFKPTPLYFMDEIDAALDFRNVSIVANYIKDRTKNAQFIIISLRNDMFELSKRLVGIYKTSNQTRSICIDNTPLNTQPQAPVKVAA